MQFWLACGNDKIWFPIPPAEFMVNDPQGTDTVEIAGFGEYLIKKNRGLKTISFESFFPSVQYHFAQHNQITNPADYVHNIKVWKYSLKTCKFFVTGIGTSMHCIVEEFEHGAETGTNDIPFSITLKEVRTFSEKRAEQKNLTFDNSYTTKKSDTFWGIARKVYGDASKGSIIASANGLASNAKITPGMVLVLP